MGEEADGAEESDLPRLSLGQRLLTVLPNLDRQKGRGPQAAAPAHTGAAEAIEPDSVTVPQQGAAEDSAASRRSTSLTRSSADYRAGRPDPTADMSNDELAYAIKRINDRERAYAIAAGPLGIGLGIALTVLAIHYNPAPHHKGHEATSILVAYGAARVVLGTLAVLAAITRRRSFVAFALLFLGTAMGNPVLAVPFWGLGAWMIWRVFKYQKALTARGVRPQRTRAPRAQLAAAQSQATLTKGPRFAARSGAADARARAQARTDARTRRRRREPVVTGPPPSKRYTPPKPPRPKPPVQT